MNFRNNISTIVKDDLLKLVAMLAIGGFCVTVGLQYPDHSILLLLGAFFWVISFAWLVPKIRRKQVEDEKMEEK